ncbi:hypothetical protein H6P81_021080 [Aristolochia fimbriata]|uniref:J domain-containing protein required for chloroplast accumulation response 1 n=1 Tax=Aristolochia fimbriata TaxID=158543 RepID=A0AAV7DW83_ARIFI|nr:hypothetical protein H6P81_021080 [Aristolochia fimbriata]
MENPYHKERILVGYTARRSLGNPMPSPKISYRRASDVDFSDVFGGPPRCSMTEDHNNPGENLGSSAEKEERLKSFKNPWSSLKEKPVFGEERQRRTHLKEDFFNDIFKVDETLSSTPKHSDPFSSMPGSRVQSPVHPSLSRQLSFTANPAKGINSPKFGSIPGHSNGVSSQFGFPSSPRASRIAAQMAVQDNTRRESRPPQRQSPLSDQFTLSSDESVKTIESTGKDMGSQYANGADSSDVSTNNRKFHFSIYKWASKGAPLTMQFRKGDRSNSLAKGNNMGIVNSSLETTPKEISMSSESEVLLRTEPQFHSQDDRPSKGQNKNEEPAPARPAGETLRSLLCKNGETVGETEQQPVELQSPELRGDNYDRAGNHEMQQQSGQTSGTLRMSAEKHETVKVKKHIGKKSILHQTEVTKASTHEVNSKEKKMGDGTKSKVKEFVKIFNSEASTKPTPYKDRTIQNSRKTGTIASDFNDKMCKGNTGKTKTEQDVAFEQGNLRNPSQQKASMNANIKHGVDSPMEKSNINQSVDPPKEKSNISRASSGTTSEGFDASVGNIVKIHSEDLENLETKIRQWSTGREGNIRSLLSTLQYVLWSDSGWKPVPLVDIIDGASVKRAYQKALLCLHPDKLQQKGAGMQEKYIAEKVFDILQEAWTQFNTLGPF